MASKTLSKALRAASSPAARAKAVATRKRNMKLKAQQQELTLDAIPDRAPKAKRGPYRKVKQGGNTVVVQLLKMALTLLEGS